MKHISPSFGILVLLTMTLATTLISCSKDGGGGQPVPGAVVTAIPTTVTGLNAETHRPEECPRGIIGAWASRDDRGRWQRESYAFGGVSIVSTTDDSQMIYDGVVRTLPSTSESGFQAQGVSIWYVGFCQNGKLIVKTHAATPTQLVFERSETISVRGRRLENRVRSNFNGMHERQKVISTRARY